MRHGWAVAAAHVRGGGGPAASSAAGDPAWHQAGAGAAGKTLAMQDLLAAAELLVGEGWGVEGQLCLAATSAGAAMAHAFSRHLFVAAVPSARDAVAVRWARAPPQARGRLAPPSTPGQSSSAAWC